jgi:hypothetical protein
MQINVNVQQDMLLIHYVHHVINAHQIVMLVHQHQNVQHVQHRIHLTQLNSAPLIAL